MIDFIKDNKGKLLVGAVLLLAGGYGYSAGYFDGHTGSQSGTAKAGSKRPAGPNGGARWGGGGRGMQGGATLKNARYAAVSKGKIDINGGLIDVAARRGGTFREVYVTEGEFVKKGQVLALQEDDEEKIALKRAEAMVRSAEANVARTKLQLEIAKRELARIKPLVSENVVSQYKVDQAADEVSRLEIDIKSQTAALSQVQASYDSARFQLEQRTVRAPMDGQIIEVRARPGVGASSLNVSTAFVLMPAAQKIVRADVDEAFVADISVGQSVIISPDAKPTQMYKGTVLRVGQVFGRRIAKDDTPGSSMSDYAIEVVLSIEDNPLKIGQRVLARFVPLGKEGKESDSDKRDAMREKWKNMTPEEREKMRRRRQESQGQ